VSYSHLVAGGAVRGGLRACRVQQLFGFTNDLNDGNDLSCLGHDRWCRYFFCHSPHSDE
jgi:hypothetical protein